MQSFRTRFGQLIFVQFTGISAFMINKRYFLSLQFSFLDKNKLISLQVLLVSISPQILHWIIVLQIFYIFNPFPWNVKNHGSLLIQRKTFMTSKHCFSVTFFHLAPLSIWNIHKNQPMIIIVKVFLIYNVISPHTLSIQSSFLCIGFTRVIDVSCITYKQLRREAISVKKVKGIKMTSNFATDNPSIYLNLGTLTYKPTIMQIFF